MKRSAPPRKGQIGEIHKRTQTAVLWDPTTHATVSTAEAREAGLLAYPSAFLRKQWARPIRQVRPRAAVASLRCATVGYFASAATCALALFIHRNGVARLTVFRVYVLGLG